MAVRRFAGNGGSPAFIQLDEGTADAILNGAFTVSALVYHAAVNDFHVVASFQLGTGHRGGLWLTTSNEVQLVSDGQDSNTGVTISLDTWSYVGADKASGTGVARGHAGPLGGSLTHGNGANSIPNDATTLDQMRIASHSNDWWYQGDIAIIAAWDRRLSDADHAALHAATTAQTWLDTAPVLMWRPGMTDPVTDDTGNGANETNHTGTSIETGNDPPVTLTLGAAVVVAPRPLVVPAAAVIRAATW